MARLAPNLQRTNGLRIHVLRCDALHGPLVRRCVSLSHTRPHFASGFAILPFSFTPGRAAFCKRMGSAQKSIDFTKPWKVIRGPFELFENSFVVEFLQPDHGLDAT